MKKLLMVPMLVVSFAIAQASFALEANAHADAQASIDMTAPASNLGAYASIDARASLRPGTVNADVKTLQAHLKNLGYYSLAVDGKYGPNTKRAVERFQADHKLSVDGIAGAKTFASLAQAASADTVVTLPGYPSGPVSDNVACPMVYKPVCGQPHVITCVKAPCPQPEPMTYGNACMLSAAGGTYLYEGECKPSKANDVVLPPITISGTITTGASLASNSSAPHSFDGNAEFKTSLRAGSTGTPVATLQASLKNLGFYPGVIDGKFGAATEAAVRSYQHKKSLKVDGVVGVNTLTHIAADSLVAASASSTLSVQ